MKKTNKRIGFVVDVELENLLDSFCDLVKTDRSLMIRTMIVDYIDKNKKYLITTTK